MKRNTIYTIGRHTYESQAIGSKMCISLAETETEVGDGNYSKYYDVLFGVDNNGIRYMALATKEHGVGEWHGSYKSGGHWHGEGRSYYVKGYNVKLRKNFGSADEANKYYMIVKTNMWNITVQDAENKDRYFTEEQIDKLFA